MTFLSRGKGGGGEGRWAPASSSVSQQSAHVSKAAANPSESRTACVRVCESVFLFFFHFHKSRFRLEWLAWGLMIRSTSILQPQVDDLQGTRSRSEAPAQAWIPCGHGKPQRPRGLSTSDLRASRWLRITPGDSHQRRMHDAFLAINRSTVQRKPANPQ